MKSRADKLIAEKLSSIDSLPEGYSPNIDSKWAIIGESAGKKKTAYYRLSIGIAASLVILLIAAIVLKNLNNQPAVIVEKQIPAKNIPQKNSNSVRENETVKENVKQPSIVDNKKQRVNKKREILIQPQQQITNTQQLHAIQSEIPELAESQPVQKKKQRYVEIDFSEPVQQSQPITDNNSAQSVRFKFGFNNSKYNNDYSVNGKPLRLHQNF